MKTTYKMKKYNIIWSLAIATAFLLSSCEDFLTQENKKGLTEEEIYSEAKYIELNIKGIYNTWKNDRTDFDALVFMLGLDDTQQGAYQTLKESPAQASLDKYDGNLNSMNGTVTGQWNRRWPTIVAAAKIVRSLENEDIQAGTQLAHLLGEASFIRGFVDFELAMYWGEIPIIDMNRTEELGYGRQPLKDVWQFIIDDLTRAAQYAPDTHDPGRATSGAAWAMLGKAYMSAPEETGLRDFSKAKECFENMMSRYSLVNYADLWNYATPNTAESILEFQFSPEYPNNNKIQFQIGSRAVQNHFGDGCYYSGYDKLVPTPFGWNMEADGGVWEEGDLRREETLRIDFTYHDVTPTLDPVLWEDIGDDHDELLPHIKKYEDIRTDKHEGSISNMWNSGKNVIVLRLGDIKLLYAECLNELNQTAEAVNVVNEVRTRAWGGTLPADKTWSTAMSQSEFREKVLDERIRELLGENWRRVDLIRTGKYVELVKERNKWANRFGNIQSHHVRYPIPDEEIKQNEDITAEDQNPGYN